MSIPTISSEISRGPRRSYALAVGQEGDLFGQLNAVLAEKGLLAGEPQSVWTAQSDAALQKALGSLAQAGRRRGPVDLPGRISLETMEQIAAAPRALFELAPEPVPFARAVPKPVAVAVSALPPARAAVEEKPTIAITEIAPSSLRPFVPSQDAVLATMPQIDASEPAVTVALRTAPLQAVMANVSPVLPELPALRVMPAVTIDPVVPDAPVMAAAPVKAPGMLASALDSVQELVGIKPAMAAANGIKPMPPVNFEGPATETDDTISEKGLGGGKFAGIDIPVLPLPGRSPLPFIAKTPLDKQREHIAKYGKDTDRIAPVVADAVITSPFNLKRTHPVLGVVKPHLGTDIDGPDDRVVAPLGGYLELDRTAKMKLKDRSHPGKGFMPGAGPEGMMATLYADDGRIYRGLHLSEIPAHFKDGDRVEKGELIGKIGATGRVKRKYDRDGHLASNGSHLHFAVMRPTVDEPQSIADFEYMNPASLYKHAMRKGVMHADIDAPTVQMANLKADRGLKIAVISAEEMRARTGGGMPDQPVPYGVYKQSIGEAVAAAMPQSSSVSFAPDGSSQANLPDAQAVAGLIPGVGTISSGR